jgi:hypothetical protein
MITTIFSTPLRRRARDSGKNKKEIKRKMKKMSICADPTRTYRAMCPALQRFYLFKSVPFVLAQTEKGDICTFSSPSLRPPCVVAV